MWAVINKTTQIVVGVLPPNANQEQINEAEKNFDLVLMTIENSPATIGFEYKNGKFIPKGDTNA